MLRRTCAALLAATVLTATPALARDKTLYLGVEAGPMWASDVDMDLDTATSDFDDFLELDHKLGYDIGVIFGYDGGMVRAELDLSYKRAGHDEVTVDGDTVFEGEDATRYIAIMTNLLLDVGNEDGLSFYAGPGVGFAWGKTDFDGLFGEETVKDGGVAWQAIAGVRYALNPNVDLGLKYRYFRPSRFKVSLGDEGEDELNGRFSSHSLLATLTYNFYTPPPPPPPPPPPLPPA
ncbi:MAG TPA: outer membrane beta-barrel protein, partial [Sphingomicrobium sp.]